MSMVAAWATPPGVGPDITARVGAAAGVACGARVSARATIVAKLRGRVSGLVDLTTASDVGVTKGEAGAESEIAARTEDV